MGEFNEAVRRLHEGHLCCPKCAAMNRPHATIIELEADGGATCGVCAHHWRPEPLPGASG